MQKQLNPLARKLAFAFVGLWLFSVATPCVLAANACPPGMGMSTCAQLKTGASDHSGVSCSELTKYTCQLPERNTPSAVSVPSDFTIVPVLLAVLPALPETLLMSSMRRVAHAPAPVTFTPLHTAHTVLRI